MREVRGLTPEWQPGRAQRAADERAAEAQATAAQARARAGAPSPAPDAPAPPAALKGAVKVEAFPERCKYPFPEIAGDGGIWKLDPAAYGPKAKAQSIRASAGKWAADHGLTATLRVVDGFVYVQFTKAAG